MLASRSMLASLVNAGATLSLGQQLGAPAAVT